MTMQPSDTGPYTQEDLGLVICDHCLEILNNFTFEFVFCK